jgi:hypothetical protein
MQNFQLISSSVPHAGQRWMVRFCPQCGQKATDRPSGKLPPQYRQLLSPRDEVDVDDAALAAV